MEMEMLEREECSSRSPKRRRTNRSISAVGRNNDQRESEYVSFEIQPEIRPDEEEEGDFENTRNNGSQIYESERVLRGKRAWVTRKARRTQKLKNADKYIHVQPAQVLPNPSTDLLKSIHYHAADFYAYHSLLSIPKKRQRAAPFQNKKRIELYKDSLSLGSGAAREERNSDSESDASGGATAEHMDDCPDRRQAGEPKGKYKVRDMYRAIEGEGLMAIGILVQEYIARKLHEAGYCFPQRAQDQYNDSEDEGSEQDVSNGENNGEDDDNNKESNEHC
nr:hypothetical protein L203_03822 [Cryptococcus depauperatus CBS 7841]